MEDMISQMPDDILVSIISLLPTKQAMGTTILSKRWRNLFRFVPAVKFSCKSNCSFVALSCNSEEFIKGVHLVQPSCNSEGFINGVHGVLQRHSTYIRSFDFRSCLSESDTQTFEQCIFSLGGLGVQKLEISVLNRFRFSCHLLSLIPSLQYFKLSGVVLLPSLNNPCNSLKTIWLVNVSIPSGSLDCVLSNCLSLCTLTLERCSLPSTLWFPRIDLQLKYFVIRWCDGLEEICFYAPNLKTFDFKCRTPVNLKFEYVPQLHLVHLKSLREDLPYFCGRLEKNVPSLDTLILDGIGELYQDGSIAMGINMFNNLKRLELSVRDIKYDLFSMTQVVHGCPRLEEFQLATSVYKYIEWPEGEMQAKVHSQLKVVDISGFRGSESEFAFISYILKSAVNMQRMIISWCINIGQDIGNKPIYLTPRLHGESEWGQVCERIQQIKHGAVSTTLQVVVQEFPQTKSIDF